MAVPAARECFFLPSSLSLTAYKRLLTGQTDLQIHDGMSRAPLSPSCICERDDPLGPRGPWQIWECLGSWGFCSPIFRGKICLRSQTRPQTLGMPGFQGSTGYCNSDFAAMPLTTSSLLGITCTLKRRRGTISSYNCRLLIYHGIRAHNADF